MPRKPVKKSTATKRKSVAKPLPAKGIVIHSPKPVVVKPAPVLEIAIHDQTIAERFFAWMRGD